MIPSWPTFSLPTFFSLLTFSLVLPLLAPLIPEMMEFRVPCVQQEFLQLLLLIHDC